jgi:hypothetical protein
MVKMDENKRVDELYANCRILELAFNHLYDEGSSIEKEDFSAIQVMIHKMSTELNELAENFGS